jgi:hypothetical protein
MTPLEWTADTVHGNEVWWGRNGPEVLCYVAYLPEAPLYALYRYRPCEENGLYPTLEEAQNAAQHLYMGI